MAEEVIITEQGDCTKVKSFTSGTPENSTDFVAADVLSGGRDRNGYDWGDILGCVHIDLPATLTSANFISAYLRVYKYDEYKWSIEHTKREAVKARMITEDWDEADVVGDYPSSGTSGVEKNVSSSGWYDLDVTAIVASWLAGSPNYGISIIQSYQLLTNDVYYAAFKGRTDATYYPRLVITKLALYSQAVGGATLTPTGGITTKKAKKGVGGALLLPEGILSDGRTENAADVPYEFTIGPTTLGINTREKRLRRIFLIVSKEASATMYVSVAMNESGDFGTEVEIAPGEQLSMVKKYIPLAVGEAANGMVLRIKVRGAGEITVHDAGAELSIREG